MKRQLDGVRCHTDCKLKILKTKWFDFQKDDLKSRVVISIQLYILRPSEIDIPDAWANIWDHIRTKTFRALSHEVPDFLSGLILKTFQAENSIAIWGFWKKNTWLRMTVRSFYQKSTCITQLRLGPYGLHIWTRNTRYISRVSWGRIFERKVGRNWTKWVSKADCVRQMKFWWKGRNPPSGPSSFGRKETLKLQRVEPALGEDLLCHLISKHWWFINWIQGNLLHRTISISKIQVHVQ